MQTKKFRFYEAINEGLDYSLKKDKNLICYGLGVTDPKEFWHNIQSQRKIRKRKSF